MSNTETLDTYMDAVINPLLLALEKAPVRSQFHNAEDYLKACEQWAEREEVKPFTNQIQKELV